MAYEKYPWHAAHAEELREAARKYRAGRNTAQKKVVAARERQYRSNNKEHYRLIEFRREMKKYTTTTKWFVETLVEQNGLCAICQHLSYCRGSLQRLQVDHDHKCCDLKTHSCGECLRGLLCADCNMKLSAVEAILKEGTIVPTEGTWLDRALSYLNQYSVQFNFGYNVAAAGRP